jgi:hypothetical protein
VSLISYAINSIAWSAAGLVIGVVIGRQVPVDTLRPRRRHRWWDRIIGPAVFVLALVTVVDSRIAQARQAEVTSCQADYNAAVVETIRLRGAAGDQDRNAVDSMVQAVVGARSREDVASALRGYIAARGDADRTRAAHPYPTVPDCKARRR